MIFAWGNRKVICPIKGTAGIERNTSVCKWYTRCGALGSPNAGGKFLLAVPLGKGLTFSTPPLVYLSLKWGGMGNACFAGGPGGLSDIMYVTCLPQPSALAHHEYSINANSN